MSAGRSAPSARWVPAPRIQSVAGDLLRTLRGADLAIAYSAVIVIVTIVLNVAPDRSRADVVEFSSTNLVNLRQDAPLALVLSAFIVPGYAGLLLVVPLLLVLAYLQRHIGRIGSLVVGLSGHVGATLVVMVVLQNGIFRGFVDPSVRHASDVGVSYACAAVAAFLTLFIRGRWRWVWVGLQVLVWILPGALSRTFTDVGHATALLIGWLLAFVAWRVVQADRRRGGTDRTGEGHPDPAAPGPRLLP